MRSFSDLLVLHHELDELFFEHQRALLRLDLDQSATMLERYETELLAHIRDEEALMIPLYRERVEVLIGGAVESFSANTTSCATFLFCSKKSWTQFLPGRLTPANTHLPKRLVLALAPESSKLLLDQLQALSAYGSFSILYGFLAMIRTLTSALRTANLRFSRTNLSALKSATF